MSIKSNEQQSVENVETVNPSIVIPEKDFFIGVKNFFASWKFKLSAVIGVVIVTLLVIFYWQHLIAVMGMKTWANHASAKPIDCMVKDTNNDEYISCTAMINEQIVPLECGTSIFNVGCRVNYGSASPSFKGLGIQSK
ncbi:hypothetical protein [Geminocystis sp. NIES-3709]|uniref:hypothetical protein n=1 Tax=Geminocystis sp. NIES-3709 TaxID=1617448 RepID=UPI0005FCD98E|nr:hypothetical protein [Geminocystis sp. NIES-3709]BAQ64028.1 arginyl-tRNA synthetase [Geminocystis sp. NIES-3709]